MTDSLSTPTSSIARLMLKTADIFEAIILKVAAVCCWSSALLIAVIILNVIMRYGFSNGLILFEEIQWHLYAIGIMFGLSYAEITNSQVRVDVVAGMLKPNTVLKWEIFGAVFFVFPTIFVILFNSIDYVSSSYLLSEGSSSPLGMPFRWVIKSAIPASFILLGMAVLARMFRNIITITQREA